MNRSLLRDRMSPAEGRVTFVELFFDLVFVFAVTQLSHFLAEHLTLEGAVQTVVLLLAVWSVWVYTTWATSWLNTNHPLVRLMFFGLLAAGLLLSTSIPDAMAERGLTFAIAIALMQNARNAFTVWSIGDRHPPSCRNFQRIQVWLVLAGFAWLWGAFLHGNARLAAWALALLLEIGSPWWKFWVPGMGFSTILDGAAFAVAFTGSVTVWWVYYATTAERASEHFEHAEHTGELARAAYTYAHIPIVAGIILMAVGDELLLAHPVGHAEPGALIVLLGGPALFLFGSAVFNRMVDGSYPRSHWVGIVALGAMSYLGGAATPLAIGALAVLLLVLVAAWETRYASSPHRAAAATHTA